MAKRRKTCDWSERLARRAVHVAALLTGAAWLLAGCTPKNEFVPPPPPQVTIAKPVEREVADSLTFTGWTQATAEVDLRARVGGYLEKVLFEDGAMVEKDQLLFVIEQEPFEAALAAAEAELQKAEASLALEQSEYNRSVELVRRRAVTEADLDVAAAELETAKANLAAAKAAVRRARLDLNYTEIRAPIAGRIGEHLIDPGNLVDMGATLLARIESVDPIYAYFSVSESDLLQYMELARQSGVTIEEASKRSWPLYLGLANEEGFPREGRFDFSERTIDRQTGTALRRGVFENEDQTLIPGLFVRIRAPLGEPRPKLLIEERAVAVDQRGDYVLTVNDEKVVEYRPVKLGDATGGLRVVEEGLEADDWVVVNGLQRARPGATVDPQRAEETSEPAVATR